MGKPVVYIASPYTKGDTCVNTHFQCRMFDRLLTEGIVIPVAPLWSHFQHIVFPRPYEDWVAYDLELIRNAGFHACLRLDATSMRLKNYRIEDSTGADREVALFKELKRPVFYDIQKLYEWARNRDADE